MTSREDPLIAANRERLDRARGNEDYAARQFVRAVRLREQAQADYERDLERHRAELADAEAA